MNQLLVLFRPSTGSELTIAVEDIFGKSDKPLDHGCLEALREIYFPEWVIDEVITAT